MELNEIIEEEQKKHRTNYARVGSLFDDDDEKNFIIFSGHFHIKFENGYEVSLFNGDESYTDNINKRFDVDEVIYSKYIELAIIKDNYFCTRDFVKIEDDVLGLVKPDELIEILNKVKAK